MHFSSALELSALKQIGNKIFSNFYFNPRMYKLTHTAIMVQCRGESDGNPFCVLICCVIVFKYHGLWYCWRLVTLCKLDFAKKKTEISLKTAEKEHFTAF